MSDKPDPWKRFHDIVYVNVAVFFIAVMLVGPGFSLLGLPVFNLLEPRWFWLHVIFVCPFIVSRIMLWLRSRKMKSRRN